MKISPPFVDLPWSPVTGNERTSHEDIGKFNSNVLDKHKLTNKQ